MRTDTLLHGNNLGHVTESVSNFTNTPTVSRLTRLKLQLQNL
jgi:hypothetical protein